MVSVTVGRIRLCRFGSLLSSHVQQCFFEGTHEWQVAICSSFLLTDRYGENNKKSQDYDVCRVLSSHSTRSAHQLSIEIMQLWAVDVAITGIAEHGVI